MRDHANAPEILTPDAGFRHRHCPTLAQIHARPGALSTETQIERRAGALVTLPILTDTRGNAIVCIQLE